MAVARLDAAVANIGTGTHTYSVSAGSNRVLVIGFSSERASSQAPTVSTVDYGGQAMTQAVELGNSSDTNMCATSIWYLLEAGIAAASNTTITPTYDNAPATSILNCASYTGVNQGGGASTVTATASAEHITGTPNPLITDVTENNEGMVFGNAVSGNASTATWHSDLTEQLDNQSGTSTGTMADRLSTTDGNVNVEATFVTPNRAVQVAAAFAPGGENTTIEVPTGPWR